MGLWVPDDENHLNDFVGDGKSIICPAKEPPMGVPELAGSLSVVYRFGLPLSVFAVCGLSLTSTRPADIRNAGVIRAPQEQSLPRQSKLPTVNAHPLHRNCPESASKSCIHSIGSMKMYSPAGRTETPSDTHVRERCAVRKSTATRYTPQPPVQKSTTYNFD